MLLACAWDGTELIIYHCGHVQRSLESSLEPTYHLDRVRACLCFCMSICLQMDVCMHARMHACVCVCMQGLLKENVMIGNVFIEMCPNS
jgi:hypothetical protein